ncbi:hypothetical protein AAFC00_003763 [Neodothiora populina]
MNNDHSRGRSLSAAHNPHLTSSASVSPHPHPSLDQSYQQQFGQQYSSAFQQQQDAQFLNPQATLLDFEQQFQAPGQAGDITQHTFLQAQTSPLPQSLQNTSYVQPNYNQQNNDSFSPGSSSVNLNVPSPYSNSSEASSFPNFDIEASNLALDPTLLYSNGNNSSNNQILQQTFDTSSLSLDAMAAAAATHHSPTPPHLLHTGVRNTSQSPSPHASPGFQQPPFNDNRPRSESLDPASAAFPPIGYHGNDWANGRAFQGHRRAPSDTYSEISTHSNQASPYLGAADDFDASPMLNAQDHPLFSDGLGLGQFTLSDPQLGQAHISPGPSPHVSPHLMPQLSPQQALPEYTSLNNFGFSPDMSQQNGGASDLYQNSGSEPFPQLSGHNSPGDFGQADVMSPPEINIEFAPPSRQASFEPNIAVVKQEDTLSPPDRSPSRNRERAKSDSFANPLTRPSTPGFAGRGRSPSLQPYKHDKDSLSPHDNRHPSSRSPSPSSSISGNRSRASSASSAPRKYYLDLANPERAGENGHDPKRVQKHPANFACTLCDKRFTRAYNLRSHLRTHTDERPFVCTICGKAFARQHDRKRHEGLHSGEKKFVCKGALSTGEQWGCGRRFARADALGRHFRSEAGRICIRPLLDEEAAERQRQWQQEQAQHQQQQMQNEQAGFAVTPMTMQQPQFHPLLPAALLQTYPELASFDWSAPANSAPIPEEMDFSGRSSFDATSSGGEWDALSENEMGSFGVPSPMPTQTNGGAVQGLGMGVNGNGNNGGWVGSGDYLSDFDGR